jgi:hypothetical protein
MSDWLGRLYWFFALVGRREWVGRVSARTAWEVALIFYPRPAPRRG